MVTRNVYKQLATMEDLAQGVGQVNQRRGNNDYSLGQVDVPYAVESEAAMSALDVTKFTLARVYYNETSSVDFIYVVDDVSGIPSNTGPGTWIVQPVVLVAPDSSKWVLAVDNTGVLSTTQLTS